QTASGARQRSRSARTDTEPRTSVNVLLEDEPQAVQGKPGLVVLDALGEAREQAAEPAGGDHRRLTELLLEPLAQSVNENGGAEDHAGLNGVAGGLPDHTAGLAQLDPAHGRGAHEQGVEADLHSREDG